MKSTFLPAFCLLLLCVLPGTHTQASQSLPPWQQLAFEQKALWATARSEISIAPLQDQDRQWRLRANSSVVSNSEEIELRLRADSGSAIDRSRLSRGKNQRLKTYEYGPESILRERRDPGKKDSEDSSKWRVTSRKTVSYPAGLDQRAVTDAYALLPLAGRFLQSGNDTLEVAVHTDLNFYRVTLSRGGAGEVEVDYQLGEQQVTGKRQVRQVVLQVAPLGPQVDKADFSLLGLNDGISLLFDTESGLPLQLRGIAPRIGDTSIELKSAILREPGE